MQKVFEEMNCVELKKKCNIKGIKGFSKCVKRNL